MLGSGKHFIFLPPFFPSFFARRRAYWERIRNILQRLFQKIRKEGKISMKQKMSRIFSALLSLMMLISLVGTGMTVASAEENYQQTNDYVLNYSGENIPGYEDYDAKRLYASPYRTDIFVTEDGGISNWNWCSASVLNMINTTKLAAGG
jgi:hypothetical protein